MQFSILNLKPSLTVSRAKLAHWASESRLQQEECLTYNSSVNPALATSTPYL